MSDHEFDTYLTLLTKLLRLSGKQRGQIASELRAHLEDRLDEMLARGMPREEAVKLALEEFGDAASLAAEFGSLSRNRKQRWLMRMTTFSAAAIVLVAAGLAIFWPGRNAGPGVAAVVAQDPDVAEPAAKPAASATDKRQGRPLQSMLEQRIEAEFEELPLADTLKFIEDSTGIQFYVKRKMLEEAGLSMDVPVTQHLRQVRVSTLLDLMFEELHLTYYEKDDLIIVSTPEEAESHPEVRVYDCRDLLGLPMPVAGAGRPPGMAGFAPGSALPPGISFPGIRETPPAANPPGGLAPGTAPPDNPTAPGGPGPRLPGALPGEIMPQFGGAGQGAAGPQPPGPGASGGFGSGGIGGEGMGGVYGPAEPLTAEEKRARALISLITTNIDSQAWDEVGGPGSISEYHGLIVVTQTAEIHKKIERVLDMLREAAGLEVGGTKKVVRYVP
jgi:hypothetical protein